MERTRRVEKIVEIDADEGPDHELEAEVQHAIAEAGLSGARKVTVKVRRTPAGTEIDVEGEE